MNIHARILEGGIDLWNVFLLSGFKALVSPNKVDAESCDIGNPSIRSLRKHSGVTCGPPFNVRARILTLFSTS